MTGKINNLSKVSFYSATNHTAQGPRLLKIEAAGSSKISSLKKKKFNTQSPGGALSASLSAYSGCLSPGVPMSMFCACSRNVLHTV